MNEKPLIYSKISEVMENVEAISKDKKNIAQGYSFRGIDDMYNVLNPHLAKAKIFFTSEVISEQREERQGKSGGALIYTILRMKWTIYAEDGSSVTTETVGEAMDSGDKGANKAMSAAYKYALMQIFCIPTNDDKDTENHTHEVTPAKKVITQKIQTSESCARCGAGMKVSKEGKKYCSALCWKTPKQEEPENVQPFIPTSEDQSLLDSLPF